MEGVPHGKIYLPNFYLKRAKSERKPCCLLLHSVNGGRDYTLRAYNESDFKNWIAALSSVVQTMSDDLAKYTK